MKRILVNVLAVLLVLVSGTVVSVSIAAQDKQEPKEKPVATLTAEQKATLDKIVTDFSAAATSEKDRQIQELKAAIAQLTAALFVAQMRLEYNCKDCELDKDGNLIKPKPAPAPTPAAKPPAKKQ